LTGVEGRWERFDPGCEPGSIGVVVEHQVEGVVLESIDALCPSTGSSKAATHSAVSRFVVITVQARVALDEEVADVAVSLADHGLELNVAHDQHVDSGELGYDRVD